MNLSDSEISQGHEESSKPPVIDETVDRGVTQMLHRSANDLHNESLQKNIPSFLDESIALYTEALASLSIPFGTRNAQKAGILYDLATAHLLRFDRCGNSLDLISNIKVNCNALCAVIMKSEDHRAILDGMLDGINRLHQLKEPSHLNQAVEYFRSSVLFGRDISSADPIFVYICGLALYKHFQLVKFAAIDDLHGGILHLDRAIQALRDVRARTELKHCRYSLACALRDRFDHLGDEGKLQDLIDSIMIHRKLLKGQGIKENLHWWALYQSSLASCLERVSFPMSQPAIRVQYKRSSRTLALIGENPIDEATEIHCAILKEPSLDDRLRPKHFLLYGVAQFTKYQLNGNAEYLAASISSYKQALGPLREYSSISPKATQDYHRACYQLAIAMLETLPAYLEGDESECMIAKVDESIALLRIAVEGEIYNCNELAKALFIRAHRSGDKSFANEGIVALMQAISDTTQGPTKHLKWASHWIDFLHENPTVRDAIDQHLQTKFLDYCLEAINMLRCVAGFDQTVNDRLATLKASSSIPHHASAHAIALGHPQLGIEMLERGRAVFWSQALRLRDASREPIVQDDAEELQYFMHMDPFIPKTRGSDAALQEILKRRRQVEAFEIALDQRLPLVIESYAQLSKSCKNGPVVVLVQGGRDSYAVLLQNHLEKPDIVILHDVDMIYLQRRYSVFNMLTRGEDERHSKARAPTEPYEMALSKLWDHIVKPIFSHLGLKKSDLEHRPRLWWCPSGLFTSLPLHAAGHYAGDHQDCVSNYVISSYATSLSSLIRAQDQLERPIIKEKVLIFAEPEPRAFFGLKPILHVSEEVEIIRDLVPEEFVVRASVPVPKDVPKAPPGAVVAYVPEVPDSVIDDHRDAQIVHFACHATQDEESPLFSHFIILNTRFTIGGLMRKEYPNARFAFLSACQTAMGDRIQSDESIHLASVMSFVGFPSIIGTMWPMNDSDGPSITKEVYKALFKDGRMNPDPNVIPIALDNAVRKLRSQTGSREAKRWAPYIHIGA